MRSLRRKLSAAMLTLTTVVAVLVAVPAGAATYKVLVFTKTAGARHASISTAVYAIQSLGNENGFEIEVTEDASAFNDQYLAQFRAVVFALTSGDVLGPAEEAAFERYISAGGGFVGIHSASDTEKTWPFYGGLVGAYFKNQPTSMKPATVVVADRVHRSTQALPDRFTMSDEWYNFTENPRGKAHILATVSESTYTGGQMGYDHPISWCQGYSGGRSWYTGMGHDQAAYSNPTFLQHLLGGIQYAATGNGKLECGGTVWSRFDKVYLDTTMNEPMSVAIAPDGRVFFVERTGAVKIYKPSEFRTVTAAQITIDHGNEHGLQGIALDPNFMSNNWVYLFYTAKTPLEERLSRFTLNGNLLDMASEKILLKFSTRRGCCHQGGSLAFGPDGLLYLSTGDDSTPFESSGYAPIDERSGQSHNDAQRTAGNRNSLQGKIHRIKPEVNGSYSIPEGNLFPADGSDGRPEVYVMGLRNPFRVSIDQRRNWLYWGDVGADAAGDNPDRGPMGYDEVNQAKAAGNFGWPYCKADNKPYRDYDFATGISGPAFDCSAPINNSPNNTGSQNLPSAKGSLIAYPSSLSKTFPELGVGNRTIETGPLYRWETAVEAPSKLPIYYDDALFIYDWSRGWIKEVKLDSAGGVLKINDFFPGAAMHPIDMEQGPDGALYVLDWGSSKASNGTVDAALFRIEYSGAHTPVAKLDESAPLSGHSPLTVNFTSQGSFDVDQEDTLSFKWDFEDDGIIDSTNPTATHIYPRGTHKVRLIVTDSSGRSSSATTLISSGNLAPNVTIEFPTDGTIHEFGQELPYRISAYDEEDGSTADGGIPCDQVELLVSLGHDNHTHSIETYNGCDGFFESPVADHGEGANLFTILTAVYTDRGASDIAPMTGTKSMVLQPARKQAEYFDSSFGVAPRKMFSGNEIGQTALAAIAHGDWAAYKTFDLEDIRSIGFRVATWSGGGRIEIRTGSPSGPMIGEAIVTTTHPQEQYQYTTVYADISAPAGTHDLYFVFRRLLPQKVGQNYVDGAPELFTINWMEFLREPTLVASISGL